MQKKRPRNATVSNWSNLLQTSFVILIFFSLYHGQKSSHSRDCVLRFPSCENTHNGIGPGFKNLPPKNYNRPLGLCTYISNTHGLKDINALYYIFSPLSADHSLLKKPLSKPHRLVSMKIAFEAMPYTGSENTNLLRQGKYHCMFDCFRFDTSFNISKADESKQIKQEFSRTMIIPFTK